MTLLGWPEIEDDSGTKQDGTIINKALFDAIKDSIEDGIDVAASTDGDISSETFQSALGSVNMVANAELRLWDNGPAIAPNQFALTGAGAAIARTGPGESDTYSIGADYYSAKLTYGAATLKLTQTIITLTEIAGIMKGRRFGMGVNVKTSTGSLVRLVVDDGIGTTTSDYHTGDGTVQWLSVNHLISSTATKLEFYVELVQAGVAYIGGFNGTFSNLPPDGWQPQSLGQRFIVGQYTFDDTPHFAQGNSVVPVQVSGIIHHSYALVGNVGAGTDDLHTYTLDAGSLVGTDAVDPDTGEGKMLRVIGSGYSANNANNKTITLNVGSGSYGLGPVTGTDGRWSCTAMVSRTAIDTLRVSVVFSGSAGFAGVNYFTVTGIDFSADDIIIKFTGVGTNNNDIVQQEMVIEVLPWSNAF